MKLLITGAWRYSDCELSSLKDMGHELYIMKDERGELPISADKIEGVICNGLFLYHPIEEFTSLRYIQLTSAGLDRIPLDYVNEKKITLKNARGVYSVPMAEYALWGVLCLYKSANALYENHRGRAWNKVRSVMELCGKRVLIVGSGSVGTECAKRFSAMGCTVIGVDACERVDEGYERIYHTSKLDKLIVDADIIVLTLPYTKENHHIINAEKINKMKSNCVLVNIARGGVVDTDALIDALVEHKIFGAVLDVFETEPLSQDSPLWDVDNVIITPHNSFIGEYNAKRLSDVIMGNLTKE